jgi:hypothetical protein
MEIVIDSLMRSWRCAPDIMVRTVGGESFGSGLTEATVRPRDDTNFASDDMAPDYICFTTIFQRSTIAPRNGG